MTAHFSPPAIGVAAEERQDWIESVESLIAAWGPDAAAELLAAVDHRAKELGAPAVASSALTTPYRNTVPAHAEPPYPGDLALEKRIAGILRWNALAMVIRANAAHADLGGHIASYASGAEIFETGFNHFFRGGPDGDLVYYQPHSAPGVYARAFLEGRLSEAELGRYRQEIDRGDGVRGLSSYPHPWLMPDFWQFPTGSMGLGPINAIHQARFLRYLRDRGLASTDGRRVWGVFGDGEMDEPESIGSLALAARERLDNLVFVINCNLQRLDGPVRGNGQIVQELEALFRGAGWNVVKCLWGSNWNPLFAADGKQALIRRLAATVDGKFQTLGAKDGAYNQRNFFEEDPDLAEMISGWTEADLDALSRGGHDFVKLHAAFDAALQEEGRPTVILAKTKKGYGMGGAGESRMTAHQTKKLDLAALRGFRDRFDLPLTDDMLENVAFFRPASDSPEMRHMAERRAALGGPAPARRTHAAAAPRPARSSFAAFADAADGKEMSTTMAAVRMLTALLKDKEIGGRIAPIVADEARTFGMASLFRSIGIYAPAGQLYAPEDDGSILAYVERRDGQLLEEGITEAGALSTWIAAATSYSAHGFSMLPIYIFYSMFGFQRVGDLIWAAADQRARGFLWGATAGRTTLGGEGLQHQDGSSQLIAASVPNCRAYDPAFAYEVAAIVDDGVRACLADQEDVFYYVTLMNEAYAQPSAPADWERTLRKDALKGLYRVSGAADAPVRILGSGALLPEVIAAADLLGEQFGVAAAVFSATSYAELERDARAAERWSRLHPDEPRSASHVGAQLPGDTPIVAVSDYVRAVPQMIAPYVDGRLTALGTDGFGRSDTRERLRAFFEVDRRHIALAALDALAKSGAVDRARVADAIRAFEIEPEAPAPWIV